LIEKNCWGKKRERTDVGKTPHFGIRTKASPGGPRCYPGHADWAPWAPWDYTRWGGDWPALDSGKKKKRTKRLTGPRGKTGGKKKKNWDRGDKTEISDGFTAGVGPGGNVVKKNP